MVTDPQSCKPKNTYRLAPYEGEFADTCPKQQRASGGDVKFLVFPRENGAVSLSLPSGTVRGGWVGCGGRRWLVRQEGEMHGAKMGKVSPAWRNLEAIFFLFPSIFPMVNVIF